MMGGEPGRALAIFLLDAVVIALAIRLGRMKRGGEQPSAPSVRTFLLALFGLGLAFAAFQPLAALALVAAYLLRGHPSLGLSARP
jgi:hypothetical protein